MANLEVIPVMALLLTLCYCQRTVLNTCDPIEPSCLQSQLDNMMQVMTGEINQLKNQLHVAKQEREKLSTELTAISRQQITTNYKRDCQDLYRAGQRSNGVYKVYPIDKDCVQQEVEVYCDMTTNGGGWTVFQKRHDGSVLFNRSWVEYKNGFGNTNGEFWLGNKYISIMTSSLQTRYVLRVDLTAFNGNTSYAEYTNFKVASETQKYKLSIGAYSGTAGDSLSYHNNRYFSTRDRDNDQNSYTCSQSSGYGGFWYRACHDVNLNGVYRNNSKRDYTGLVWDGWIYDQVQQATSMKFRPMICQ